MVKRTAAQRARSYHRRREQLIRQLGGKCLSCGATEKLEFHHKQTRTWTAREKPRWLRIKLYEEEADQGLIDLRCSDCNKKLGQPEHNYEESDW